jgi:hypothetical protein
MLYIKISHCHICECGMGVVHKACDTHLDCFDNLRFLLPGREIDPLKL